MATTKLILGFGDKRFLLFFLYWYLFCAWTYPFDFKGASSTLIFFKVSKKRTLIA